MKQYFFLLSSFAPLSLHSPPPLAWEDALFLFQQNTHQKDWRLCQYLQLYIDLQNLPALYLGSPLKPGGLFNAKELEDGLQNSLELFPGIEAYFKTFSSSDERIHNLPALITDFFEEIEQQNIHNAFFIDFFEQERQKRAFFAWIRAQETEEKLEDVFALENHSSSLIYTLMQGSCDEVSEYKDLHKLFQQFGQDPLKLHKALLKKQWDFLENTRKKEPFSTEAMCALFIQYLLVLDEQKCRKSQEDLPFLDMLIGEG